MFKAKVINVNSDTSSQLGSVRVQFDINNDGIWDNYYANYLHVVPRSGIKKDDVFLENEYIATIDSDKGLGYGTHLDLKDTNLTNSRSIKLYRFYRHVSSWKNGAYLDYFTGDAYVGNSLFINAVSSRVLSYDALSHIELYYKIGSNGTWDKATTVFNELYTDLHRYEINLKEATKATTGQTIYYYLAGIRNDLPTNSYNHGLFPQYYKKPDKELTTVRANTIARQFTIQ